MEIVVLVYSLLWVIQDLYHQPYLFKGPNTWRQALLCITL